MNRTAGQHLAYRSLEGPSGRSPGAPGRGAPPWSRRRIPVILLLGAALLAVSGADAAARRIRIQGRILDPAGHGVAGQTVKLFKSRRGLTIGKFSSGGQIAEAIRVTTDDSGYYAIDIPRDRSFDNYFLRFWDPETFDAVMYSRPDDLEITRRLRREDPLRVEIQLKQHPRWEEVSKMLSRLGEGSDKGKILRQMGLPEKETVGEGPGGAREEWWYHSRGVVYFFRDGEASGFRRFEPVESIDESAEN